MTENKLFKKAVLHQYGMKQKIIYLYIRLFFK